MRRNWAAIVGAVIAVVATSIWPPATTSAVSSATVADGTISLIVDVPEGGTALVEIRSTNGADVLRTVVVDDDATVHVQMPPGTYRILPRQITVDGERFVAGAQPHSVRVKSATSTETSIDYARSLGVQQLRVTDIGTTSVALDWEVELGDETTVWRLAGDDAPTRPGQGTEVSLTDSSSFTDTGLEPGAVYTYSIFARPGDGAFGRDDVDPVSITVSLDDGDPSTPLFVLSPGTRILDPDEFAAFSTGDSLILELAPGVGTPTPGTTIIVPATPALPGGYLGEVIAISADGKRVELVMGSMASAFDLYHLEIPDFSALAQSDLDFDATPPAGTLDGAQGATGPQSFAAAEAAPAVVAAAPSPAAVDVKCGGTSGLKVTPDIEITDSGHADITIDKWKIRFFPDVPHTLNFDVGYAATLQATVKVEGEIAAFCGIDLPRLSNNVTYYPVPLAYEFRPVARINLISKGTVENLGGSVTAGFQTDGKLSITGLPQVGGDLILETNATEPTIIEEAGLNLNVGGSLTFGPGVGSKNVGLVLGLKGEFSPLDATASLVTVEKNGVEDACVKVEAQTTIGLAASLRAWVPGYSTDYSVTIDELQGSFPWGGSPYWWPNDCTQSDTPTNDVVGDGLTVIGDSVTGDDDQFGKVDGFVPGENTWVLSTGNINDVVGSPSTFASSGMGQPGDPALSQLSGNTTYDAAAYEVTVVPTGQTLVVRYAFGSEEYPEYVGSQYNDVMAVFVDGQNCAVVPNTTTPVSINSINDQSNSQYYVDNSSGASGYNTTMDGLTVPLECRVAVTPGQQVTIRIAVADASDSIYDSAVALLDGGIYSE